MTNSKGQSFSKRGEVNNFFTTYLVFDLNGTRLFQIIGKDNLLRHLTEKGLEFNNVQAIDLSNDNWLSNDCEFAENIATMRAY